MFDIPAPGNLAPKITVEDIVDILCQKIVERIALHNAKGERECTFYCGGFWGNYKTGEILFEVTREAIRDPEFIYFTFEAYEELIEKRFIEKGYRITPCNRKAHPAPGLRMIHW